MNDSIKPYAPCIKSGCTNEAVMGKVLCNDCDTLSKVSQKSAAEQAVAQRNKDRIMNTALSTRYPKYYKRVPDGVVDMDTYIINRMFPIDSKDDPTGCVLHSRKKLLIPGTRTGGKSFYDDIREARDTLTRYLEIMGPEQGNRAEDGQVERGVAKVPKEQPKTFENSPEFVISVKA